MPRKIEPRDVLAITNANKAWVVGELERLRREWSGWLVEAVALPDSPDFDPNTCTEAIKDGFENRRRHEVLREKTLVFIANHFAGYSFLFENWPPHPHEDNTARLAQIIPGWLHRLETLSACVDYARVPEGYWKEKAKELVSVITKAAPEKAVDIAASYLKNPLGQ